MPDHVIPIPGNVNSSAQDPGTGSATLIRYEDDFIVSSGKPGLAGWITRIVHQPFILFAS